MHSTLKFRCSLIIALVLWSSAFVGIRISLEGGYSPGSLTFLRLMVASICLWFMTRNLQGKIPIPWGDRCRLMGLGVVGIGIYHLSLNFGEMTVPAGIASFIVGLIPIFTVILVWLFFQEPMRPVLWLGIGISFIGLFLIFWEEDQISGSELGQIAILLTAFVGAVLNIWQKPWLKKYHLVDVTAWIMWGGTLSVLIFAPYFLKECTTASLEATLSGIYLGIFPAALANLAWGYVLHHRTVSKASITLYSLPILSTAMGYLILGETVSVIAFLGGMIALLGAVIANTFKNPDPSIE